jgi:hypothetical protein
MDERQEPRRRVSLVGPVILIGLGIVLLLNNLGILDWDVWDVVFRLWPVLLIAAGLEVLIGRRSALGSLLALIVTLALVAGVLWLVSTGVVIGQTGPIEEISQPLDGATGAKVVISPAVGTLHLASLSESDDLIAGTIYPVKGEHIARDSEIEGDTVAFSLKSHGEFRGPFFGGWGPEQGWNLKLARSVPLDLTVDIGVGQAKLDLGDLNVTDLSTNMGIGQTSVTLPGRGRLQAHVEGGIGSLDIVIPSGMEARIHFDTGLVGRSLPNSYKDSGGDVYITPGYAGADNRIDLEVELGIGAVTVCHSREG